MELNCRDDFFLCSFVVAKKRSTITWAVELNRSVELNDLF